MRLLLDTHVLIWWDEGAPLSKKAMEAIRDAEQVYVPLRLAHTEILAELPTHHGDPFDRMLVAQARAEGLTLVTRDWTLLRRYGVRVLKA